MESLFIQKYLFLKNSPLWLILSSRVTYRYPTLSAYSIVYSKSQLLDYLYAKYAILSPSSNPLNLTKAKYYKWKKNYEKEKRIFITNIIL